MDSERVLAAAVTVVYVAGAVWFYLHCVRPALVWHRARWTAQALLGLLSVLPAAALVVTPAAGTLSVVASVAWVGLMVGWLFPAFLTRATGGQAPPRRPLDEVFGWLNPAADRLDVGDLEGARAQVDEARRHAPPEAVAYVELWAALVTEEEQRRRGERISRIARLKAIREEYARLVLGADAIPPFWEAAIVVAVGSVALASVARA